MHLNEQTNSRPWRIRPDGQAKVTGELRYLTDMTSPGKLIGRVLRSGVPHARLLSVDTSKAKELPGVVSVLTSKDVPGLNGFGIAEPNQPVFCEDLIRYEGDAIAAVAAETNEIAERALELIEFEYEELPVLDTPEKALSSDAPLLHAEGNILHETSYSKGDVQKAFNLCHAIVEETYETPRQMHAFMETEGGIFVPEKHGKLTVYSPTQHGYKDQMQLARILGIPADDIRVVSSPIGGSFGGKDELNVQPFGALLALSSGKPVKMHYSRKESVIAGLKRHPMKVRMKSGVNQKGKLIAHQVEIISDTGAYATLGGPVLNFATEHAIGCYIIPHIELKGKAVYTNNGISGEFRGFGGNQVIFALEGQMDRLAEKINVDPWELRSRNLRTLHDLGPLGQRVLPNDGPSQVWEAIQETPLYKKTEHPPSVDEPWIVTGKGMSLAMHGSGLGYGIPDPAGGQIRLNEQGKIEVAFGHEEFGQGLLGTLEIMLLDHFNCDVEDLEIIIGDTALVPPSGSSTASRTTNMVWRALQNMKRPFLDKLFFKVNELTGEPVEQLQTGKNGIWKEAKQGEGREFVLTFQELAASCTEPLKCSTEFDFPVTPDPVIGGHYLYGSTSVIAEVEVNMLTGMIRVTGIDHVVAAGEVVNPLGYLGQIEGGSIMALGFTIIEDALMENGNYVTKNFDTYLVPTIADVPEIQHVEAVEELPEGDVHGPRGVGEIGSVALAPAIVSAIKQATGKWVTKLPVNPETILNVWDEPFPMDKEERKKGRERV
ncbi:xanthine dehydrogenase subunit D [Salipaludibacillus keqinensis]|uniref:Xanthine dehydrogenase subunit D n=1 Tax=Salipaludibacillus keqinensis TaxID=2045207 RepID=A0A323TLC0_9BACI|nr:xanthine dehydrogenase subunit D [Salipaludibacillus keqinensis]PYZ94744.1 xanthine dehydrogenase subunit D [Salipaludibacillus keqinensis]